MEIWDSASELYPPGTIKSKSIIPEHKTMGYPWYCTVVAGSQELRTVFR